MPEKSRLSFNLTSSLLIIQLRDNDLYYKSVITGHIKSYLGLLPNHELDDNIISLNVMDITQLGSLVKNILAILQASSIEVVLDDNIQSALSNAKEAENDFIQFSEEARRIRNAESVLDEIPDFLNVVKSNMKRQPFKKQLLASFHIAFAKNVANFSVPGTGKTTMVYTAFAAMKS